MWRIVPLDIIFGLTAVLLRDIDVLALDKTGTVRFGNRMAPAFDPAPGISELELHAAAFPVDAAPPS